MNFKGFLMDHLGFFAPHQLMNAVVSVLIAGLIGFVLARWGGRRDGRSARQMALWSAVAALALVFVKTNLPLAVAFVGVILMGREALPRTGPSALFVGALLLGGACGAGASIGALILSVPFFLLLRWAHDGVERP